MPNIDHESRSSLKFETQSLIHRALELGWLRKSAAPEIKPESYLRRETRARWHAHGLNSSGKPRRNKPHPELANLDRKTYHREYMRRRRNKMTNDERRMTNDEFTLHAPGNSKPKTRNSINDPQTAH